MTVYYRMCHIPSTNPSPVFQDDKLRLNTLCLKSFVRAFVKIQPHVEFILDYCPPEYDDMIKRVVPFSYTLHHTELGINGTCLFQYERAMTSTDNIFLFQECDYFYRPLIGFDFLLAIKALGLVSPYDHLNFYMDPTIHSPTVELNLINNHHYRTTERNTMTFGIRSDVFKKNYEIFKKYGYLDNDVWRDLRAAGQQLYTPIPSFATHMVKDYIAPGVDWDYESTY